MSKFLNYVKKFLTLSFISAIAAFCLPFNNHVDAAAFVGSSAKASSNIYEDSTTGYKYLLKASDSTAEWVGTTNDDAVIDVPAEITKGSTTFSVTKATLGNDFSNVVELNLDIENFVDDDSTESITVKSTKNLGRLSKVVLKNYDQPAASGSDLSPGIEITDVNAGALNDILEQNSIKGLASWYIKDAADEDDGVGKLIGEANLPSANVNATDFTAKTPGVTYEKRGNDWYITEFSNLPTVVLPLAFVDTNTDELETVKGLSLDKGMVISQVNKVIITNIQDATKMPKIMKLAQSALQGLDNGKNDPVDWELDTKNSNDTMLTFVKVDRDLKTILLDTTKDVIDYLKTPGASSDPETWSTIKDIINKDFAGASENDIKAKNIILEILDSLINSDLAETLKSILMDQLPYNTATDSDYSKIMEEFRQTIKKHLDNDPDSIDANNILLEILDSFGDSDLTKALKSMLQNDISSTESSSLLNDALASWWKEYYGEDNDTITLAGLIVGLKQSVKEVYDQLPEKDKKTAEYILEELDKNIAAKVILSEILDYVSDSDLKDIFKAMLMSDIFSESDSSSSSTNFFGSSSSSDESTSSTDNSSNSSASSTTSSTSTKDTSLGLTAKDASDKSDSGESTDGGSSEKSSSLLADTINAWNTWIRSDGANKDTKTQVNYLKEQINKVYDQLSEKEKEEAARYLTEIDDALAAMDAASSSQSSSSGTSSKGTTGTSTGTSTTNTTSSSAKTKTSDPYASTELLSLILSGSLTGLGLSLKKRDE